MKMHEADADNVNEAARLLMETLGADSTWFAAAWSDIYRRMQAVERNARAPSEDTTSGN
jgi:hypothetical protein